MQMPCSWSSRLFDMTFTPRAMFCADSAAEGSVLTDEIETKEPKDLKSNRSKKKWFGKQKHVASDSHPVDTATKSTFPLPPPQQEVEEVMKLTNEQNGGTKDVSFMANVTADSVALAASEVVSVSVASRFAGKSEEIAAIRIQTAFRGYQIGEEWDDSLQSKEQIEANLQKKFEAAMKRE